MSVVDYYQKGKIEVIISDEGINIIILLVRDE